MTLPRPELSELLGVSYRRIPIVTIGADVYCDTSLIISALERRFPKSEGYPTLFPARKGGGSVDTGMVKAFAMYYADRAVFPIASSTLPYDKFPESFLKDRSDVSILYCFTSGKVDCSCFSIAEQRSTSRHLLHGFRKQRAL